LAAEGVRLTFRQGSVANYVLPPLPRREMGRNCWFHCNAAVFKDTADNVRGIFASAARHRRPETTLKTNCRRRSSTRLP